MAKAMSSAASKMPANAGVMMPKPPPGSASALPTAKFPTAKGSMPGPEPKGPPPKPEAASPPTAKAKPEAKAKAPALT